MTRKLFTRSAALIGVGFLVYLSPAFGITVKQCKLEAKNELENYYCEILEKGKGQSLPDFYSFRRNPATTQILLLKGPAKRLGIALPSVTKPSRNNKPQAPNFNNDNETKPKTTQPKTEVSKVPTTKTQTSKTQISKTQKNQNFLIDCRLEKERIFCNDARYYLTINIPGNRLSPEVLSEDNQLKFPLPFANQSTSQYLSALYPTYIEKMLLIGLGDSTMSFTKFNAVYEASIEQGENFSDRFAKMYELLKNERKTMAVKKRYRNNFPEKIEQCMQLNMNLVACDNVEQNWVYKKLGSL